MALSQVAKLRIHEGMTLYVLHPPRNFSEVLAPLPPGVKVVSAGKKIDQVHWFVKDKTQLEAELSSVMKMVVDEVLCWVYYPKGTSKIKTDLTRDKGWDSLLQYDLQWVNLVSFDDTWSAFGFRQKTNADRKKNNKVVEREIFKYIDAKTKQVTLPGDLALALKDSPGVKPWFDSLSFTNRKEFVEWIVSARREDTRRQRVTETIIRLGKEWKNPRNL